MSADRTVAESPEPKIIRLSDVEAFNLRSLLDHLLPDYARLGWRRHVEIVRDYMPPFPGPDTKPKLVVRYTGGEEEGFLRYSHGPRQGHFWDMYGDDYHSPELALIAIMQAPPPPRAYSITFELPLKPRTP